MRLAFQFPPASPGCENSGQVSAIKHLESRDGWPKVVHDKTLSLTAHLTLQLLDWDRDLVLSTK